MSELDKSIEELEKEVLADLSEAEMKKDTSAAGKGAVAAEPMKAIDAEEDEVQDLGAPVVKGDEKKADAAKSVKKDGSIKAKVKGDEKPMKLQAAENYEGFTDDEVRELCHSKDHDCATVVEHPIWGKGKPVHGQHAIPTDDGYVEWYDVEFKHGIEKKVMAEDVKVLKMSSHPKSETYGTKTAAINAMNDMMKKMPAADVKELVANYMAKDKKTDEEIELEGLSKAKEAIEKRLASINVSEDVDALVEGEELSEDFKKKAATIFEAAVKSKIRPEVERIEEEKSQEIADEMETFKTELAEKVDGYLDYVVGEWMKENELAIERGLKGEIAEDFITGLKSLFEEHYIDVPDEKYDILESQAQKIEELESKLNETMNKLTEKKQSEDSLVREATIKEVSSDLAETQVEKFASLVEDVEFTDKESFEEKLNTLKENYFPKSVPSEQTLTEENEDGTQEIDISDAMAAYTSAIKRSAPYMRDGQQSEPFNNVKK
tara:strand:- start:249 stop:1721 length:1473 start_codon:yes stop_codon:yes gene_type:complete